MPTTLRELRERAQSSMQQVRNQVSSLATRSTSFVQRRVSAFNEYISGFKSRSNSDDQNWSTTTSERNLSRGSSKEIFGQFTRDRLLTCAAQLTILIHGFILTRNNPSSISLIFT